MSSRASFEAERFADYNALPRGARERFLGVVEAGPILRMPVEHELGLVKWIGLLGLGIAVAVTAAASGWGTASRGWITSGLGAALLYGAAAFAVALAVLSIARDWQAKRALPFPPGRYLLPGGVLDARAERLRFLPHTLLTGVKSEREPLQNVALVHHKVELAYQGGRVEKFNILGTGKQLAEDEVKGLLGRKAQILTAIEAGDDDALRALDPFAEPRPEEDPAGPRSPADEAGGPRAKALSPVLGQRYAIAAALGALATIVLWQKVLPALAIADARRDDTTSAYRTLAKNHPLGWVETEAKAGIHRRYEVGHQGFRHRAKARPEVAAAGDRLLDWLELHGNGPAIRVQVEGKGDATLAQADKVLAQQVAETPGATAAAFADRFREGLPAGRTGTQHAELVGCLQAALSGGVYGDVPGDVLSLQPGRWQSEDEIRALDAAGGPLLTVRYTIGWSGRIYEGRGKRLFAAPRLSVALTLAIPDGGPELPLSVSVDPPEHLEVSHFTIGGVDPVLDVRDPMQAYFEDEQVYGRVVQSLFEVLPPAAQRDFFDDLSR